MILAKLYTEQEGGKWRPLSTEIDKEYFELTQRDVGDELNIDWPIWIGEINTIGFYAYSLMFEDGTIYDSGKRQRFRSENDFPKDETIEYMNKILTAEIQ